jgi:site-specific DNA-methyltransferase (adenine-specific)
MTPYYADESVTLHHGDALDVLTSLPDCSVDAVVTDPPYGLEFMGQGWDGADGFRRSLNPADVERDSVFGRTSRTGPEYRAGPLFQQWCQAWAAECLRVLKPGGHLLAFGGTRTWHRLVCAAEDAGFEIRDSVAWLYGSGFPKSLDVSKAIDKSRRRDYVVAAVALGLDVPGNNLHDWTKAEHSPGDAWWERFKAHIPTNDWQRIERSVHGERTRRATGRMAQGAGGFAFGEVFQITAPATDDAGRWAGWGTALKPAHEPIVVARKPLAGTVAANVIAHGTGALNVDGCRVAHASADDLATSKAKNPGRGDLVTSGVYGAERPQQSVNDAGRWPTNVTMDKAAAAGLDQQQSGASRVFPVFRYEAKAPTEERPVVAGVAHPTVKPLDLMRWLVRLVTPPGGVCLDPFAGSGTTAEACVLEGFRCIAIEREPTYLPLIVARLARPMQPVLDLGDVS